MSKPSEIEYKRWKKKTNQLMIYDTDWMVDGKTNKNKSVF